MARGRYSFALFGDPVAHSRSPAIHAAAFAATGLKGTYAAVRIDAAGLGAALEGVRVGDLDGANVTMPHKEAAAACCDRLQDAASRLGVVNTVFEAGGSLVGGNTDAPGITDAWQRRALPDQAPALILGGGAAARAALVALEGRDLAIATRRPGAGRETAAAVGVSCDEIPWGDPVEGAVVVNATPLGMAGEPLPDRVLGGAAALFDMAYTHGDTPAVATARGRGIAFVDGLDLLVAQAIRSFGLWTGVEPPLEPLEAAARA